MKALKNVRLWIFGVMLISFVLFLVDATGAPKTETKKKISVSLSDVIKKALRHNSEIKIENQEIKISESFQKQAKAGKLPTIETIGFVAPIFSELGNAVTTTEDWDKWGHYLRSYTYVLQPVYTFGKISEYNEAAKRGVRAARKKREMKVDQVIFDAKKYFYGAQMAGDMISQLNDTQSKLTKVIRRIDELLKAGSGEVRQEDAFKLKVLLGELKKGKEMAKKGSNLAMEALAYQGGYGSNVELSLKERSIKRANFTLKSLQHYKDMALQSRPEFMALKSGIRARKALVEAQKAGRYPMFFLGALLDAADTPSDVRNRQPSPYANDPFNTITGGVALGFRWSLDFWKVNSKVSELKAEYRKLLRKKEMAERGIPVEVAKAYGEFREAMNTIKIAKTQRGHAKKWMTQAVFAWSFGIGKSREVLESVMFKGISDKNYFDSMFKHNVAIAALSKSTGKELLKDLQY